MDRPVWSFLLAAGGAGKRLGGVPKQFRMLGGVAVWKWSVNTAMSLRKRGLISDIVIAAPSDMVAEISAETEKMGIKVTAGGKERSDSVLNGLAECCGSHVLVHDGARPFMTAELCERIMKAAESAGAAVPLLPSVDSLKKIQNGKMSAEDRSLYFRTQTPQAFERGKLVSLLQRSGSAADEATQWLAAGYGIADVAGSEKNFKITSRFDWEMACALAENMIERRTGHGYDIHQLRQGRDLVLAGVKVDCDGWGLLGHSDADVVTHTLMDAMLGAAGEPDIGTLFPASDEEWHNADSIMLLHRVFDLLCEKGWHVEWADLTLIAQRPKLGHLIPKFIENLNRELGGSSDHPLFNMKVKSAEHCGSAGRGECMICHGIATITRIKDL
ncbi:MAG: 2-C-methyl-D-erythritol 2,4-cyclodiphosphate synthase [Synergistes sp.]|nr:2-C-methyl-D-erythritol 2,4-cyclodiphosphate synthase [Synergistes sp.]